MLTISLAGLRIGIDNQYDLTPRMEEWLTQGPPDFTVRVSPEALDREDGGRGLDRADLEFLCVYREIAERLPDYDAFVLHGVAISTGGRAYLLTAPSGTGKTTQALMWFRGLRGKTSILNGDKPILRRSPEGFRVWGTPWRGKEGMGRNADLPVQGICLLRRGDAPAITPASPGEMVRFLARQIYLPRDPDRAARLLELLDALCRTVPIWNHTCTLDPEGYRVAYEAMRPK